MPKCHLHGLDRLSTRGRKAVAEVPHLNDLTISIIPIQGQPTSKYGYHAYNMMG